MKKWWQAAKGRVHDDVTQVVKFIDNNQQYRRVENLRHARLYGNLDILGLSAVTYARPNPTTLNHRVTMNVVQMCVDTLTAKVAKNRPWSTFLTEGGDPSLQKRAKLLEQFVAGQKYITKAHEKKVMAFRDACVFGTGFLKVYPNFDSSGISIERIIPDEIKVDDSDAIYGYPTSLYQVKTVSRDVLLQLYKSQEKILNNLETANKLQGFYTNDYADMVTIVEAWHLPTLKDSDDGRHVICVDGADLFDEKWKKPFFPFVKYTLNPKLFGFWGQGISEQLVGIQIEINKLLKNVQTAHHLLSAPAVYVENGSKIVSAHMNNDIGRIVRYTGVKPIVEAAQTMHPEIYAHIERLYQRAFEIVGISQLSVASHKPMGLNSGKALREYNDIETERFAIAGQRWEQMDLELSEQLIACGNELFEQDKSFAVYAREKKFLKKIDWKSVNMDEDKYQMHVFPTSALPNEPAGKLQYVQELMQAGMIAAEDGLELLDFPDLEQYQNLHTAARNNVRNTVQKILEDGAYEAPEPFMDLQFAVSYTQTIYNQYKIDGLPEEKLELLRRFAEQASMMIESAQTQQQASLPMQAPGNVNAA